jgi:putative nucleotidyltransferase with HDIG domain
MPDPIAVGIDRPNPEYRPAGVMLRHGKAHDRAGHIDDALEAYQQAIRLAENTREAAVGVEALRRLAVLHHRRASPDLARELCGQSYTKALELGDSVLAGEALNALAGFDVEEGEIVAARRTYLDALALAEKSEALRGRIEQNLGVLAKVQGDYAGASDHYRRSLAAFQGAGDERGCAFAYHNVGMIASQRGELDDAERSFAASAEIAVSVGDVHLQGLCELNRAEVLHARQQYAQAMRRAESALTIFEQLGARMDKSEAYKVIGMVFRETGRPALAEERIRSAMTLAVETGWVLGQAEASRELARLYQTSGRNQEALTLLNAAHGFFSRLDARVDLVDIARKMTELEGAFLAVVRDWGQSIESADEYTFGHCERVAQYAVAVARALGLNDMQQTTLRLGAYLHDVGKVRVPHEVLNKPSRLTDDEFEIMKLHPVYGVEVLEGVEFPWDIKPIIRWHHEKIDGTGYPDRLRGDELPLGPQVIGLVDVFDALTTTRSYRGAMSREMALAELERCRGCWQPEVFAAFMTSVGSPTWKEALPASA